MDIIIATNNAHKVEEFKRLLTPMGYEVYSLKDKGIQVEIEENGSTFAENAMIKAQTIYDMVHLPVIADDSGICVDSLDGRPGIYSARYGGEGLDDHGRNLKLLEELQGVTNRTGRFVCSIAYIDAKGEKHSFEGICEGVIGFEEKGENGFGYDPLFLVGDKSFAQLSGAEKDALSHRGKANRLLCAYIAEQK